MARFDLVLVGEDQGYLRLLSLELSRRRISTGLAYERGVLTELLAADPFLVVIDHVGPLDLYALNPRDCGYGGPVVLITPVPDSPVATEILHPSRVLSRSMLVRSLSEELARLLSELRPSSE